MMTVMEVIVRGMQGGRMNVATKILQKMAMLMMTATGTVVTMPICL